MVNDPYHSLTKVENKLVNITYNVNETVRVTDKWKKSKPDYIVYFFHKGKVNDDNMDKYQKNSEWVEKNLPNTTIIKDHVDYVDFYALMEKLGKIFRICKKQGHKLSINLGTGSKMVAIANMFAFQLWGKKLEIETYYPYTKNYKANRKEATHLGKIIEADLPEFQFRIPNDRIIKTLQVLYHQYTHQPFGRKNEEVDLGEWRREVFETYKILEDKKDKNSRNSYFNNAIVKPLKEDWGYIEVKKKKTGRKRNVKFTKNGKNVARVLYQFDYGIEFNRK